MSMCGVLLLLLLSPLCKVFAAPGDGHLSGVPLEKDGSLNGNYVQETLFGGDREGDDNKLGLLFDMADRNKDKRLSERELQSWILTKTQEHMDESDAKVHVQFSTVDPDRDGFVTWTEFGSRYLEGQGLQEDEILNILHQNLSLIQDANVHKVLSEMWESWRDADENPTDGRLSEEEFSTFLHPEHSRTTLLHLARSILQNLDKDGDGKLNEDEFSRPTSGDYSSKEQEERAQEFRLVIDSNKDGHASASEMEEFLDPLNEHTALKEARHMIAVVDHDHDGFLERSELLAAGEYFTGSKFMDFLTRHEDL